MSASEQLSTVERIAMLEQSQRGTDNAIISISQSLERLTRIEEQNNQEREHGRQQDELIAKILDKQHSHDILLTQVVEMRSWFLGGLGLVVSGVIVALIALVIK